MIDKSISEPPERRPIGGELILPVGGLLFTLYYFSTIIDSPWTAQVSAFFIGAILIALVLAFIAKVAALVMRGEATLGFGGLFNQADLASGRLWLFAATLGYIVLIPWAGFTLTTFAFLFAGTMVLDKGRRAGFKAALAAVFSLGGYLLFILAFETRFPKGPFEQFMQAVL